MPAFSYTQPIFGPEDDEREQADLTNEEKEAILDDLHGRLLDDVDANNVHQQLHDCNHRYQAAVLNSFPGGEIHYESNSNDEDISPSLMEEYRTSLDRIPFEDKAEYLQALARNETLFESECNPVRFLRFKNYNAMDAAKTMTNYWKMRVKVFGVDRAFLPMILMGAMHDDIDEWKSEVPTLCYFAPNDAKGRSVICFQRKVADVHALTNSLMARIIWYVFHLALEREFSQRNGVVFININQLQNLDQFDRTQAKICGDSVRDCIPLHIAAQHYIPSGVVERFIAPVIKLFISADMRKRFLIHRARDSSGELIWDLQKYGLRREGLPTVVGGLYEVDPNWIERLLEAEGEEMTRILF